MANLPKLVLNRNYVMSTLFGHSIEFIKGVPTTVPKIVYQDALNIGAQPAEGETLDILPPDGDNDAPTDGAERAEKIMAAMLRMFEKNERDDFTSAGAPRVDAVSKAVGWKVHAKELQIVLQDYHNKKAAGEL